MVWESLRALKAETSESKKASMSRSRSISMSMSRSDQQEPVDDTTEAFAAWLIKQEEESRAATTTSGNTDDHLVEDEHEVERLLSYLRFVELAAGECERERERERERECECEHREHRERRQSQTQSLTQTQIQARDRTQAQMQMKMQMKARKRSRSISDADGCYEILGSGSLVVPVPSGSGMKVTVADAVANDAVAVGHVAAVHPERREVVLALSYDRLCSCSTTTTTRTSSLLASGGYTLVVCGHSLGAALACRVGSLAKERNPSLTVGVYAFGPPPGLGATANGNGNGNGNDSCDATASNANANANVTVIVNNHDCVPRWTPSNLAVLDKLAKWTMRSTFCHFRRHHQARYNASIALVPPFSLPSREWNRFWKTKSKPHNNARTQTRTRAPTRTTLPVNAPAPVPVPTLVPVPGRVHTHRPVGPADDYDNHNNNHNHNNDPDFPHGSHHVLGRLWVDRSMVRDHTLGAYKANLELLLEQVANTI
eukprot:jgi/Psemu1/326644/estExt_fgenesh1_pg.C_4370001